MNVIDWLSIPEIAVQLRASERTIVRALTDLDLTESRAHSRIDDAGARVYSPAVVRLVGRELAAAAMRVSDDEPAEDLGERLAAFDVTVRSFAACLCFHRSHGRADCPQHRPRPEPRGLMHMDFVP